MQTEITKKAQKKFDATIAIAIIMLLVVVAYYSYATTTTATAALGIFVFSTSSQILLARFKAYRGLLFIAFGIFSIPFILLMFLFCNKKERQIILHQILLGNKK